MQTETLWFPTKLIGPKSTKYKMKIYKIDNRNCNTKYLSVHCDVLYLNKEDAIQAAKKMIDMILASVREEKNPRYIGMGHYVSTEYHIDEVELFDCFGVVADTTFENGTVKDDGTVYVNVLDIAEAYKPNDVKITQRL